jgi:transposase InsO family protein
MEAIYRVFDISRQAVHQSSTRQRGQVHAADKLILQAQSVRKNHPRMGCRKLANRIKDESGIGRDKVEALLLARGFRIKRKINYVRTTYSQREMYFPNLIQGIKLDNKNQVIQTDITYYRVGENHYYITFLLDVYTRRIIGYNVGKTLKASENIKALMMAFRTRQGDKLQGMIHHSDRGSQYINKEYLELLKSDGIEISMCNYAWENAYGERINRTIKEEYLDAKRINNFIQLKRETAKSVHLYNHDRSHNGLFRKMTPVAFEEYIKDHCANSLQQMTLYQPVEQLSTNN